MKHQITEREIDLLDAHIEAAGNLIADLKKKAVALRQSLAPVSTRARPLKGKCADAALSASVKANLLLNMQRRAARLQQKPLK